MRLELPVEDLLSEALATMREAVATASEARVMSFLLDERLSAKARKGKLDNAFATMKRQNKEYGMEIVLHTIIQQHATSFMLAP